MFQLTPVSFAQKNGVSLDLVELTLNDLPEILTIEKAASPHPWSEKNFTDSLQSSHICVGIKEGEQWCGHAVFSVAAGEAELLILAVDPVKQGSGIAKCLLGEMQSQLSRVASTMFLEVRESNETAIGLYEALGFNQIGERVNYYPAKKGRENALIYASHIQDEGLFE
ncbi:MAG: ribosomal protein S18-alanine N-acetyltransferase [Agarilytica sp.]